MEYGRAINLSRDGWMEERCLGAGGFGTVMLYENKVIVFPYSSAIIFPLSKYSKHKPGLGFQGHVEAVFSFSKL